jgi:hypothetical protein
MSIEYHTDRREEGPKQLSGDRHDFLTAQLVPTYVLRQSYAAINAAWISKPGQPPNEDRCFQPCSSPSLPYYPVAQMHTLRPRLLSKPSFRCFARQPSAGAAFESPARPLSTSPPPLSSVPYLPFLLCPLSFLVRRRLLLLGGSHVELHTPGHTQTQKSDHNSTFLDFQ